MMPRPEDHALAPVPMRVGMRLPRGAFELRMDLTWPGHGVTVLWGDSGAGKTSVLRALAGLTRPIEARIEVAGECWQDTRAGVWVAPHHRRVGMVFQEASLFDHLDVRGNLTYGLQRSATPWKALQEPIELLGIGALLDRRVQALSGGERQRIALARALSTSPRVLLLDEPLASLDARRKREVLPYLQRVCAHLKIPVVYVTHAMDEMVRLADHVVVMQAGQVMAHGPAREVFDLVGAEGWGLDQEPASVLEGQVVEVDAQWHLWRVQAQGLSLWIPQEGSLPRDRVRLRVAARDVSVTLDPPENSSIQNRWPAVVCHMRPAAHPSQVLLQLQCAQTTLWARITARAAHQLQLREGVGLWVQVKSAALMG